MTIKDTKFEQHYKMIADNSAFKETYVIKFNNEPLEFVGVPTIEGSLPLEKKDTFNLKIVLPAEFEGERRNCEIQEIEYMRKEVPETGGK